MTRGPVVSFALPALATLIVLGSSLAQADILFLDQFKNVTFAQTGNGNTLSGNGTFYSAELNTSIANSYTSVTMTYPGAGSPVDVPQSSPTVYHFQTSVFADQAAMDAAFPFGTYSFATNTPDSASYQYTADDYASNPFLTGTDFSSLQGMNPGNPFTFHLSTDTTSATDPFIFFTIVDLTKGTVVFNEGFLPPTTSTITLAANSLAFGDSFSYEIDYSNRDFVTSPGATFPAQLGFDTRTDGLFSTQAAAATPEPSTLALFGLGLVAAALIRRRGTAR
jgi:hypothetical protein